MGELIESELSTGLGSVNPIGIGHPEPDLKREISKTLSESPQRARDSLRVLGKVRVEFMGIPAPLSAAEAGAHPGKPAVPRATGQVSTDLSPSSHLARTAPR